MGDEIKIFNNDEMYALYIGDRCFACNDYDASIEDHVDAMRQMLFELGVSVSQLSEPLEDD